MEVAEVAPGLWRWTAPHPEWTPDEGGPDGWEPDVASYYCEAAGDILLIDPIVPAEAVERERFWTALDRDVGRRAPPHIVLTCSWHARSAPDVLERYAGARLWEPAGSAGPAHDPLRTGDPLPGGAVAIPGFVGDAEVLLWLPSHAALVAGDTLLGGGPAGVRLCPDSWLDGADPAGVRSTLRALLAPFPVERVLVTHGEPLLTGARDALDRALTV